MAAHAAQLPLSQHSMPPCCQSVGPCEVRATLAVAPDVAPAVIPVSPVFLPDGWRPLQQPLSVTPFDVTEGPPLYLRHATLLI